MNFAAQAQKLTSYYKWHAPFYDISRWSFLFGRRRLIHHLPSLPSKPRILEIGCGTGRNLKDINRLYPDSYLTGIDVSPHMLAKARRKKSSRNVELIEGPYGFKKMGSKPFDLVLLSYSMTMMGGSINTVLQQIQRDLKPGGHIAVVDFHRTRVGWFRCWMKANHVRMDGTLLPRLKNQYRSLYCSVHAAYFGFWWYFMFVGQLP